jgi:hypothetical protein
VKATGQLILLGMEIQPDGRVRDPIPPIRPDAKYGGNLLDAYPGNSPWVEYSVVAWAEFLGSELEENPGDIRLHRLGGQS